MSLQYKGRQREQCQPRAIPSPRHRSRRQDPPPLSHPVNAIREGVVNHISHPQLPVITHHLSPAATYYHLQPVADRVDRVTVAPDVKSGLHRLWSSSLRVGL
ncbi:hypothetical protein AAFF_G00095940 [Aldrovandia affinis]|uniref:Uncharacterized protein n=1 Tax=Aldrovandia affinis TaxID=143900 RepID=A0AAD7RVQ9_9TELE|nr:hypothetical protein AAFF_G00095940 [Aldrovandia affinis]